MLLQFKLGTGPLVRHEVDSIPEVGDRLLLPYPAGGKYPVIIDSIWRGATAKQSIFYGAWM